MAYSRPSKAPSEPVVFGSPRSSSITVRFVITNITGNPPPTYSILYGTTTDPTTFGTVTRVSKSVTTYQAVLNNLNADTIYYIKSVAINSVGIKTSSPAIIKTAIALTLPSKAPTVPVVFGSPKIKSITTRFDVLGITSNSKQTYSILYGNTKNPTTVGSVKLVSGTIYEAVLNNLKPNTTYYIKSVAKNSVGNETSSSAIIKTAVPPIPPTKAPSSPLVFGTPTGTSITTRFDVAGITGNPTPTYSILYGNTKNPTTVGIATLVSGTTYQAVLNGLTADTTYYIKSVATNSIGNKTSSSAIIKTGRPPSKAPTVPLVFGTPTGTSITTRFDVAGITGDIPITYSILYGTSPNPTTVGNATLVSDTTYQAVINDLTADTAYYIKSVATNFIGIKTSSSAIIKTGIPPSKAPSIPVVFGTPTSASITTRFDVADIMSDLPITYSILYGTTTNPTTVGDAKLISDTIYEAVLNGLTADTKYYIKSVAKNFVGNKTSSSAIIKTNVRPAPPSKSPTQPVLFGTPTGTSMSIRFDTADIIGNPTPTYSILYGTTTDPTTVGSVTLVRRTTYHAVLNNLTEDTTYYIKSVASNSIGNKTSSSTIIKTGTPPSKAPTEPVVFGTPTGTSITTRFDTYGIIGDMPIRYSILYGTSPNPTTVGGGIRLVSGTTYQAVLNNLTEDTTYYIKSVATNSIGNKTSSSTIIKTGTPPSQAPTTPTLFGSPTSTSITIRFDVEGIISNPTPTYSILYGTTANPTITGNARLLSGTIYQAVLNGLTGDTTYYIKSVATNIAGNKRSLSTTIKTDLPLISPSKAPSIPVMFGSPTTTSITTRFDVAGITGNPPPTYSILYGTTTNPTTVGNATFVNGTIYQANLNELTENTTYYIKSVASNSIGNKTSSSAIIKTVLGVSSPSKSPTVPIVFGSPTLTSITTRFDVAGIIGNPPPTYSILYGTTIDPTTVGTATFVNGTIYEAVLNGLTSTSTYYIKSVATNSVGSKTSASAVIKTGILPLISPSKAPSIPVMFGSPTGTSITTRFDVAGITGNPPPTYSILYGTTIDPTTVGTATLVSGTIYEANLNELTENTTYYIKSVATNSIGNKISSTAVIKTGILPLKAPTIPVVFRSSTATSTIIRFDTHGITEELPITYSILYGTTTDPTSVGNATLANGTIYEAVIDGLSIDTIYYIKSVTTTFNGNKISEPLIITLNPPSKAPTIPVVFDIPTATSITIRFDVEGIISNPTPTYSILYGTTTDPSSVGIATFVSGTIYQAILNDLSEDTLYYIKSVASNCYGSISSEDAIISTNILIPPTIAPSIPTLVSSTSTSITVEFDIKDVNGTPPFNLFITHSTSLDTNDTIYETPVTLYSGTIYRGTIDDLDEDTTYYIKSFVENDVNGISSEPVSLITRTS